MALDSKDAWKAFRDIAKAWITAGRELPAVLRSLLLFEFLLFVIVIVSMCSNNTNKSNFCYLGITLMVLVFMVITVMFLLRPPPPDHPLESGQRMRVDAILGTGGTR